MAIRNVIRLVWSAAFLIGAFNHGRQILAGGWLPYHFAPLALNWFWTLLLPVDLLTVVLLWWRVRAGALFGMIVMIADVGLNTGFVITHAIEGLFMALQLQTLFLGFVVGSLAILLADRRMPGR